MQNAHDTSFGGVAEIEIDFSRGSVSSSRAFDSLYGVSPGGDEIAYEKWLRFVHDDDRETVDSQIRAMARDRLRECEFEYRIVRPDDDSARWILSRWNFIEAHRGAQNRLRGVLIDFTAQKQRELTVRRSEAGFRLLADVVPQVIWTNDGAGFADYFNRRWYDYTGLNYEQSMGVGWQAIVHPDDAETANMLWDEARAVGKMFDTEYRLRAADGSYRWFVGRNVPLKTPAGDVEAWFGSATDIEELKRAQVRAHQSESRLRVTLESATDYAIISIDTMGRIFGWSAGAERAFGYNEQSVLGAPAEIVFTAEDRQAGIPRLEMTRARDHGRAEDERWHVRKDGSRFYMSGVMAPIYDGALIGFVKVARDMTERRQAEEATRESEARYRVLSEDLSQTKDALIAADQQKDQFIATLAHELRNPLAPVRSAMQLISLSGSHDPQVLWALDVVNRQTTMMTRLIDDLMDISRISQNKLLLRTDRVNLSTVLQDAVEVARPLMEVRRHEFRMQVPPAPIQLIGDQTRLAQVFANLLDNAAKYTEPGGCITLSAYLHNDTVEVRVEDNGIGIAAENITKIFGLFNQVRTTSDRGKGGLGIGLSLVQQLVKMHGGDITARSEGPGKGSTLIVVLPLAIGRYAPREERDHATAEPDALAGVKILIVDDNADGADALDALLTQQGATVRTAYDGETGLALAEDVRPDVVLLDIGLPQLTGHEVASRIRQHAWGAGLILIAISGWGSDLEKKNSYAAGFDRHLVKPADPVRLVQIIKELLEDQSAN